MESVCRTFRPPNLSVSFPSIFSPPPRPLNPSSSKTLISFRSPSKPHPPIRCSHQPRHSASQSQILAPNPLPSVLAAAATAAALLLARLRFPPIAIASVVSPTTVASVNSVKSDQALSDEEKERKLEEHLNSHPNDVHSLRSLMELKVKFEKFQDAIAVADRIIQLDPEEKELPLMKAHIQCYSGDVESARQGFEELLAKDPLLVEAFHGLMMVERQAEGDLDGLLKRVEGALETCKKLKRKEDVRDYKMLIAQIKVVESRFDEALRMYQDLVKEEPRDFRPYLCQGIIYTLLQKKEEADKQFEKYRRLVPKEHPYSQFFDDNMNAMKIFAQMEENKRKESLKI